MLPDKSIKSPEAFVREELTSVLRCVTNSSNEDTEPGMNVVKDDRDWDKVAVARFWSPFDLKVSSITSLFQHLQKQ